MQRTSLKALKAKVEFLNKITGSSTEYSDKKAGEFRTNIGHYYLSQAYGGVSLYRVTNESGGVEDVFSCGHETKKNLFNRIDGFINGIRGWGGEK